MTSDAPVTPFFGREAELARLQDLTRKNVASIAVVKGRRRVGKSRLLVATGPAASGTLFAGT
jgi:uncharacterized protein